MVVESGARQHRLTPETEAQRRPSINNLIIPHVLGRQMRDSNGKNTPDLLAIIMTFRFAAIKRAY